MTWDPQNPSGGGGFGAPPGGAPAGGGIAPAGPPGGGGFAPPGGGGGGPLSRIPFTPDEDRTIGSAGSFMMFAGIITILGALLGIVKTGVQLWAAPALEGAAVFGAACGNLIAVLVAFVFGAWLILGSRALKKVVTDDENDQVHLMQAIDKLRQVFALKAVLIVVVFLLSCVIGLVVGGAMVASQS